MKYRVFLIFLLGMVVAMSLSLPKTGMIAQAPTATPVQINLATIVPVTDVIQQESLPTLTWTPLPVTINIQLEALEFANVRAEPNTEAEILGTINNGELYNVLGRNFEWYQIQFDASPNGRAWVYGQIVTIIGDASQIPEIDPASSPSVSSIDVQATGTQLSIASTPGMLLTATAQARQAANQAAVSPEELLNIGATPGLLPTFTYPPNVQRLQPTEVVIEAEVEDVIETPVTTIDAGVAVNAPILPILVLTAAGLVALLLGMIRK